MDEGFWTLWRIFIAFLLVTATLVVVFRNNLFNFYRRCVHYLTVINNPHGFFLCSVSTISDYSLNQQVKNVINV